MDKHYEHLLFETDDKGIATVTINRPDKLNALNSDVLNELEDLFNDIHERDDIIGVLVTGAGDKAFVAGADIKELTDLNSLRGTVTSERGQEVFQIIEDTPKPVIAVVNGYALGGGLELALACHLRVGDKSAVFGLPEVSLGTIPGYGGTQRLPRLIGKGRALEMIVTATKIKADLALAYGLINRLSAVGDAMDEARELMNNIVQNGPLAVSMAIKSVQASDGNVEEGFRFEAESFGELCDTADFKEGTEAFLSKRNPEFTGN